MRRFIGAVMMTVIAFGLGNSARADDAKAVLDKAIKALGGEEKLNSLKAATWKTKGKITFNGSDNPFSTQTTIQGLDHFRQEFEGDFGGNQIKGATVVNGDKGWRRFNENNMDLDKEALANEKRSVYLLWVPVTILTLKEKGFKVEAAPDEKVGDKPAAVLKITGPDGKDFKTYFDKESGLPVKQVAKVLDFMGQEFTQET